MAQTPQVIDYNGYDDDEECLFDTNAPPTGHRKKGRSPISDILVFDSSSENCRT